MKSVQKVQPTDHELLVLMLSGDEEAFTALYRRRQGPVYRFALQMTGNVVIAEDVTQEVFMALLSKTAKFDASRGSLASFFSASPATWFCGGLKRPRKLKIMQARKTFSTT